MREPRAFRGWPAHFPAEYDAALGFPAIADDFYDGDTCYAWVRFGPEAYGYRALRIAGVDARELRDEGGLTALGVLVGALRSDPIKAKLLYKSFDRWVAIVTLEDGRVLRDVLIEADPELFVPWSRARAEAHMRAAVGPPEDATWRFSGPASSWWTGGTCGDEDPRERRGEG